MKIALALAALALSISAAAAQTTQFYGPQGQYRGQAQTFPDGTTNFYGPQGQYRGNAQSYGGTTTYYGSQGQYRGSSTYGPSGGDPINQLWGGKNGTIVLDPD